MFLGQVLTIFQTGPTFLVPRCVLIQNFTKIVKQKYFNPKLPVSSFDYNQVQI